MSGSFARVVEIHPESHSVDVVVMRSGQRFAGVPVMSGFSGSDHGFTDMSEPAETGYDAKTNGKRDVFAVLETVDGMPVVKGFLYPQVSQMMFEEKGRMLYRHGSDVYLTIAPDGSTELAHPSGAYIRLAADPDHEDLSAKDFDKKWKIERNSSPVSVRVEANGCKITIDTGGKLTIEANGVEIISDVEIKGDVKIDGEVKASGDIVASDRISLTNHGHPGVGPPT